MDTELTLIFCVNLHGLYLMAVKFCINKSYKLTGGYAICNLYSYTSPNIKFCN